METLKILKEFYETMLRDYNNEPVIDGVNAVLSIMQDKYGPCEFIEYHKNMDQNLCIAKAVLKNIGL